MQAKRDISRETTTLLILTLQIIMVRLVLVFNDNGEQENIGIASVAAAFNHPTISATVSDTSTISIVSEVGLVQECTYVEIPSSVPDAIVRDGGGIESTSIKAKLFDDNENSLMSLDWLGLF